MRHLAATAVAGISTLYTLTKVCLCIERRTKGIRYIHVRNVKPLGWRLALVYTYILKLRPRGDVLYGYKYNERVFPRCNCRDSPRPSRADLIILVLNRTALYVRASICGLSCSKPSFTCRRIQNKGKPRRYYKKFCVLFDMIGTDNYI